MNDFKELLFAIGRGFIKLLISAVVGVGVGLLLAGISMSNRRFDPQMWARESEVLIGVGAGLLSGGAMLVLVFLLPWLFKRAPQRRYIDEPPPRERTAPPVAEETRRPGFYEK